MGVTLVNAEAIPFRDVDTESVRSGVRTLRTSASTIRDGGADVVTTWQPISQHYDGPGAEELFAVMDPVKTSAADFADNLGSVATALGGFADEVEPIVSKLKSYYWSARTLRDDVAHFQPYERWSWWAMAHVPVESWDQDEDLVDRNNAIVNGVADLVVQFEAAERTCANSIRAIVGLSPLHSYDGDPDDPLAYGYDALPEGTELPWGTAGDREESCAEKGATFVPKMFKGLLVDGLVGTLEGLGGLVGMNFEGGFSWTWDNFTTTWGAMGGLISYNAQTGEWGDWGYAGEAWKQMGKSTIAWDEWSKDPGTAFGASIFNVGITVVPVAGVVGKVGAGGRVAGAVGRVGNVALKAADFVDPIALTVRGLTSAMPKLSELASSGLGRLANGAGRVADRLPFMQGGHFHFDTPHTHVDVPSPHSEPHPGDPGSGATVPDRQLVTHGAGSEGGGSHGGGSEGGSSHAGGSEGTGSGHSETGHGSGEGAGHGSNDGAGHGSQPGSDSGAHGESGGHSDNTGSDGAGHDGGSGHNDGVGHDGGATHEGSSSEGPGHDGGSSQDSSGGDGSHHDGTHQEGDGPAGGAEPRPIPTAEQALADVPGVQVSEGKVYLDGEPKMTTDQWQDIYTESVHNGSSPESMLGKFVSPGHPDSYVTKAINGDYRYFDLGTRWDEIIRDYGLDGDGMFDLFNRPFLDDALRHGDGFTFSHDPFDPAYEGSALHHEGLRLKEAGYKFEWNDGSLSATPE